MKIHCSHLGPDFENVVIEAIHNHEPCSDAGVAVAVIKDGRLEFAGGFGFRDRAAVTPVDVETRFAIGSATKAFTSMAASILAAQGNFTLKTPIKDLLPDFDMKDPDAASKTTLEDILCHRTGLAPHNCLWYLGPFTRSEIFHRLRYLQPARGFGTSYVYNNIMYMVAGFLLESVTGTDYEDIVQACILDPLGMTRTNLSYPEFTTRPNHAKGYEKFAQLPLKDFTNIGPAAEINSSALDMAKWVQLFLKKGVGANGVTLLGQASMELMYTPFSDPGDGTKYGLGWNIGSIQATSQPAQDKRLIFHTGDPDGQSAYVSFMPDDGLAVVVLTNQQCTNDLINDWPDKVATDIYDYLLNGKVTGQLNLPKPKAPTGLGMDRRPAPVVTAPKGAAAPAAADTLGDYTGMYSNAGYGELVVSRCGDSLNISYYGSSWPLQSFTDTLFAFQVPAFGTIFPVKVVFTKDTAGGMKSLAATLVLQPTVIDIAFDKR
jgi:CubicO group peptidase (beta-lactamase class C family)